MARNESVSRWWLVAVAAAAMGVAGTYQFVWSSIRATLGARLAAPEAALGTVFTLFVVAQTVAQFPAGRFRDRHGPRVPMVVGALLLGAGYLGTAYANSIEQVYVAYVVGGTGVAAIYTVAVNTPVKWLDERRGLAAGIVTMAYSGISVVFIPFVRDGVETDFTETLFAMAAVAVGVCLLAAVVVRDPADADIDADDADGTSDEQAGYTWRETARTWQFYVLYGVFVIVNGVGLMLIGKAVSFTLELGLPAAVATGAASVVALADSAGVLVGSSLSDRLGRERILGASLLCSGLALAGGVAVGLRNLEAAFVVFVGAAAFFRSPAFGILPVLVGEYYGTRHSSENYALLYSAKIWGGVVGGVATSLLIAAVGWSTSFLFGAGLLLVAGITAFTLRPVDRGSSS